MQMIEQKYKDAVNYIIGTGKLHENRTGINTLSVFGHIMRIDLENEFPILTTKKLDIQSISSELLWFLEGSTDERRLAELRYEKPRYLLKDHKTIWTANANSQGVELGYQNDDEAKELGPVYGKQWRDFGGVDQIKSVIDQIKNDSNSRRIIMSAWNPVDIPDMALPPCHIMIHFRVDGDKLSGLMYQRSCDVGLGMPYNIASYALLIELVARECGLKAGELVYTIGDMHIYENHIPQLLEQISREPYSLPKLNIDENFSLMAGLNNGFNLDSASLITLKDYKYHSAIKMQIAV